MVLVVIGGPDPDRHQRQSNGGRIIDRLFAGLMSCDAVGQAVAGIAQSIESA